MTEGKGEIAELFLPVGAIAALLLLAKPDVSGDEEVESSRSNMATSSGKPLIGGEQ